MDGLYFHVMASPIGRLGLVTSEVGLARVLFEADGIEEARLLHDDSPHTPVAAYQLEEYFAGRLRTFTAPLDYRFVTGFRAEVLRELAQVPFGETTTYRELAGAVGNPRAVRAVGGACANNPLPLFVPCHRVLRADGALGGYRGGVEAKRLLLEMEGIDV